MTTPVGKRVAALRAAHGQALREASIRTGVSHTTIARIENGEVTGSFHSTLRKIADGYGVSMEWLLTGKETSPDLNAQLAAQAVAAQAGRYVGALRQINAAGITPEVLKQYVDIIHRAEQAGLRLAVVEMAIDLMIQQHRHVAAGRSPC